MLTNLEDINIAYNMINGSVPMFGHLEHLETVILKKNIFDTVRANTFAGDSMLRLVDMSFQNVDMFILRMRAFANMNNNNPDFQVLFTDNIVVSIPPLCFEGLSSVALDLSSLSIKYLDDDAFYGTSNLTLDLSGNYIEGISNSSFPRNSVRVNRQCEDYFGWTERCHMFSLGSDSENCFDQDSYVPFYRISFFYLTHTHTHIYIYI